MGPLIGGPFLLFGSICQGFGFGGTGIFMYLYCSGQEPGTFYRTRVVLRERVGWQGVLQG